MFLAEITDLAMRLDRSTFTVDDEGVSFAIPAKRLLIGAVPDTREEDIPAVMAWLRRLLPLLKAAQPFRFADVPGFTGKRKFSDLPLPDSHGVALFNSGVVRPPFDVCWFELVDRIVEGEKLGLGFLIETQGDDIRVHPFERMEIEGCAAISTRLYAPVLVRGGDELRFDMLDPFGKFAQEQAEEVAKGNTSIGRYALRTLPATACIYLMLVMASNRKTIETVKPGLIERRRRSDKGLSPLKDIRVVTMPPDWRPAELDPPGGQGPTAEGTGPR